MDSNFQAERQVALDALQQVASDEHADSAARVRAAEVILAHTQN